MCFMICRCFGWILDLFQRLITYMFACSISCGVCCGLLVATGAGVAYGYNYSMAEFLTFARSDVSVYVRRGQFNDKPDVSANKFRRTGDIDDLFPSNVSDYQDEKPPVDSKPLSNTWVKVQDARKYAEKLTKFSTSEKSIPAKSRLDQPALVQDLPVNAQNPSILQPKSAQLATPRRPNAKASNLLMFSTKIFPIGKTGMIMRNFKPVEKIDPGASSMISREYDIYGDDDGELKRAKARDKTKKHKESSPDIKIRVDDNPKSNYVPMRYWGVSKPPAPVEYVSDDVEEDIIIYKPV